MRDMGCGKAGPYFSGGHTALILASKNGHKEVVESLLSAGADVNYQIIVCDIYGCCDE